MKKDTFTSPDAIIEKIFDPRKNNDYIHPSVKMLYWRHYLQTHWEEICGKDLARLCSVYQLKDGELHISTSSSMLANVMFMEQKTFLNKINKALNKKLKLKKIYFRTVGALKREERQKRALEAEQEVPITIKRCSQCGALTRSTGSICTCCERDNRTKMRHKIAELLKLQPWLDYEACNEFYKCDKIIFTSVKDNLKNYYFEKVCTNSASDIESLLAVLLTTGLQPEAMTDKIYANTLAYIRRNNSVFTSRSRLYGQK